MSQRPDDCSSGRTITPADEYSHGLWPRSPLIEKVCSTMMVAMKQCQRPSIFLHRWWSLTCTKIIAYLLITFTSAQLLQSFSWTTVRNFMEQLEVTTSIFERILSTFHWRKEKHHSTDQRTTSKSLFPSTGQQRKNQVSI